MTARATTLLTRSFAATSASLVVLLAGCGGDDAGSTSGPGAEGDAAEPAAGTAGPPGEEMCDILDGQEIGSVGTATLTNTVVTSETQAMRSCQYSIGDSGMVTFTLGLVDGEGQRPGMEQLVSSGTATEVDAIGEYATFVENEGLRVVVDDQKWLAVNVAVAADGGGAATDQQASEAAAELAVAGVEDTY